MQKKPDVSVIIPAYNVEQFICKTLESVLSQKGVDFEVILINDGSTDRTAEIISKFDNSIIILEQKENKGPAVARNLGIERSRGELIAFLDADDRWLENHLSRLKDFADQNRDVLLFYGDVWQIDEKGERIKIQRAEREPNFMKLLLGNFIITSSVMIRKNFFESGERFHPELPPSEDWDLWLRVIERGKIKWYPWISVEYRKHQKSLIKSKKELAKMNSFRVLGRAFQRNPEISLKFQKKARARVCLESAVRELSSLELNSARREAIDAIKLEPFLIKAWALWLLSFSGETGIKLAKKFKSKNL